MTTRKRAVRKSTGRPTERAKQVTAALIERLQREEGQAIEALRSRARARAEAAKPMRDMLQRLDVMRGRLPRVRTDALETDPRQRAIQVRVLRSHQLISHIYDEFLKSNGADVDYVRLELVNALRWEIDAISLLPGRRKGAVGDVQKALRALLDDDSNADTHAALLRLNEAVPGHGMKRRSITVALSKARTKRRKS